VGRAGCAGCPPTKQVTTGGYDTANSDEHRRQILRDFTESDIHAYCESNTNLYADGDSNCHANGYTDLNSFTLSVPDAFA
jgi:hypothetical protein